MKLKKNWSKRRQEEEKRSREQMEQIGKKNHNKMVDVNQTTMTNSVSAQ